MREGIVGGKGGVPRQSGLAKAVLVGLLMTSNTAIAALAESSVRPEGQSEQASTKFSFSIAEQQMESALEAFAEQTGLQVVYASKSAVRDLNAPRIAGTMTAGEALKSMLQPSGLTYEFINARTVMVRAATSVGAGKSEEGSPIAAPTPSNRQPAPDGDAVQTLETMTVVGTNLRNIDPATPLMIIDSEMIEQRGHASIEDVLRHLPQNLSSRTSVAADLGESEFGGSSGQIVSQVGASAINLRGLGERATLVLVNGKRRTGSAQAQGSFTDISSIPIEQIERIEILTDGASAIYGADAVAGVVNIVLKKDYEGATLSARVENSSSDADARRLDFGYTYGWGTGSLTATLGQRKSQPADIWSHVHVGPQGVGDFTDQGGVNTRRQFVGQPGAVFEARNVGSSSSPDYRTGRLLGLVPSGQDGSSLQPSDLIPVTAQTSVPSLYEQGRVGPELDSSSVRLSGRQELGEQLALTYGAGYNRQKNIETWQPTLFDFNFLTSGARYTVVPTDNPWNHFGRVVLVGYSYEREFEGMRLSQQQSQKDIDYNVGLSGKLPWASSWDFELSYTGGRQSGSTDLMRDITGGIGAVGLERVRPVLAGLNVFGDGSDPKVVESNRALIETLIEHQVHHFDSRINTLDTVLRGDLFELPGGRAELAAGAQYRQEGYDRSRQLFLARGLSTHRLESERTAKAVFTELGLPLAKDLPWAKQLSLTLAARRETFDQHGMNVFTNRAYAAVTGADMVAMGGFDLPSLVGALPGSERNQPGPPTVVERSFSSTSPLVRLSWKPFDSLRLRTTWGQSFMTPEVSQQFGDIRALNGTHAVGFSGASLPPGITSVVVLVGVNPNLKPQTATTRTFGFDYSPAFVPGLSVGATYSTIDFENYIGDPLEGMSIVDVFSDISKLPKSIFIKGDNGVLLWDQRKINFLGRRFRGVDLNASYYTFNRWGDWRMELNAMRTLQLVARTLPQMPEVTFSDSEHGPSKWGSDLFVNWSKDAWNASVGAHYSSDHRVLNPLSARRTEYNNFKPNLNPRRHAGSYTTFDVQLGYQAQAKEGWREGMGVQIGVQNLFDRAFPFVDNGRYGFVSNRVNVRGRVLYLNVKKAF